MKVFVIVILSIAIVQSFVHGVKASDGPDSEGVVAHFIEFVTRTLALIFVCVGM